MKKAIVILTPIIIVLIIIVAFALQDSTGKGSGTVEKSTYEIIAQAEWDDAGEAAQQVVCDIYNAPDTSEESLYLQMTEGRQRMSPELAAAKLALMREKC